MKIKINISSDILIKPIMAEAILETGVLLNISQAHFDRSHGEVVADVDEDKYELMMKSLTNKGAVVTQLDTPIKWDENECVECSACVSVCPTKVFSLDEDFNLKVDETKCIQCGTCVDMCPHNALSLGNNK
ncbi:4Fe-4S binding protein [Methanolobus bombayensis]|uniref:4Fe-4S binding protein n=1 Tax=Methanolobus bombayensis TaxID=38023 RepID=UPI001AE9D05E|nr:4Fe-4S binding protein [Methanolobus bombayensis]MBP1910613.1 NAD-dependent dihydropyrimidine dehydrogenase PreA subunit [Methanolobus bombayensis]